MTSDNFQTGDNTTSQTAVRSEWQAVAKEVAWLVAAGGMAMTGVVLGHNFNSGIEKTLWYGLTVLNTLHAAWRMYNINEALLHASPKPPIVSAAWKDVAKEVAWTLVGGGTTLSALAFAVDRYASDVSSTFWGCAAVIQTLNTAWRVRNVRRALSKLHSPAVC